MVQLVPMKEHQFKDWLEGDIRAYAEENIRSGRWTNENALEMSRKEHEKLLPDGLATKDNYIFSVEDEALGKHVGVLWLAVMNWGAGPAAFVYDIVILKEFRRRGYGTGAMRAAEEKAKALGLKTIALHVFGDNHAAQDLYRKLGYEVTNINMSKKLT